MSSNEREDRLGYAERLTVAQRRVRRDEITGLYVHTPEMPSGRSVGRVYLGSVRLSLAHYERARIVPPDGRLLACRFVGEARTPNDVRELHVVSATEEELGLG